MRLEDVGVILPYGLVVGAHVTPIDHGYFSPIVFRSARDTYEVRAIADGVITDIGRRDINVDAGTAKPSEYRIWTWHTCDFASYFDLVTSLSPKLKEAFDQYSRGGSHAGGFSLPIKEGELVGKIGGQTLDFGVYNYAKTLSGFIVPEHYEREDWKIHTDDMFGYFKPELRDRLLALNPRQAEPRSGKIDYDQDGKLVGNWFKVGTNGYAGESGAQKYWSGHLSFLYNYIDPTALMISVGNFNGEAQQFGVKGNTPDPSIINVTSGLQKYELVELEEYHSATGARWDKMSAASDIKARPLNTVLGVILVEMVETRKIKFEVFPGKTAAQVSGFTDKAAIYER